MSHTLALCNNSILLLFLPPFQIDNCSSTNYADDARDYCDRRRFDVTQSPHKSSRKENYKLKHIKRRFSCIHRKRHNCLLIFYCSLLIHAWRGSKFERCEYARRMGRREQNAIANITRRLSHYWVFSSPLRARTHNSFSSTHPVLFATWMIMMMTYIRPFSSATNFFRSTPFN